MYLADRAAAVNLAGALLGSGCLAMALLVAGTFYVYGTEHSGVDRRHPRSVFRGVRRHALSRQLRPSERFHQARTHAGPLASRGIARSYFAISVRKRVGDGRGVFGSITLAVTNNRFGGMAGVILIGGAWAPIYPLIAEKIGDSFSYYHPGLFNGISRWHSAGRCSLRARWACWPAFGESGR
jgi:hypothetical protein